MDYITITKRKIKFSQFSGDEKILLQKALDLYVNNADWGDFADWWQKEYFRDSSPVSDVVFRICHDLEARLGIKQGYVRKPDYRDWIVNVIDENFESRQDFCERFGIEPQTFYRIILGEQQPSMEIKKKFLTLLGNIGEDWANKPLPSDPEKIIIFLDAEVKDGLAEEPGENLKAAVA